MVKTSKQHFDSNDAKLINDFDTSILSITKGPRHRQAASEDSDQTGRISAQSGPSLRWARLPLCWCRQTFQKQLNLMI